MPLQYGAGTIKRSNSKTKSEQGDRPSTAPQKENEKTSNPAMKRLPSPNLKCKIYINLANMGSSAKNINLSSIGSLNITKYRTPSPSTTTKPTIMIGTIKNTGAGKPKWK
jgi:hypothetical protein